MSAPKPTAPGSNPSPSWLLLGLIALGALAFAVVVPPFQVTDEHGHFVRAYDISHGHLVSQDVPALPPDVIAAVLHYPELLEEKSKLRVSELAADAAGHRPLPPGQTPVLADDADHRWLTHSV